MVTLTSLITEAFNQKLVNQLIQKYQQEDPSLAEDTILAFLTRFEQIKNSPNVPEKDITKYSWKDLEATIEANQKKKVKAGKVDITAEDANLIYDQDGIRMYVGKDKKACIKYGNGTSFCISARGDKNMYDTYRHGKGGTPFFIFNDKLPPKNPNRLIVIFSYKQDRWDSPKPFTVSNITNAGDKEYSSFAQIVKRLPWVAPLERFIGNVEPPEIEKEEQEIKGRYRSAVYTAFRNGNISHDGDSPVWLDFYRMIQTKPEKLLEIRDNKKLGYLFRNDREEYREVHLINIDKSDLKTQLEQTVSDLAGQNGDKAAIARDLTARNITLHFKAIFRDPDVEEVLNEVEYEYDKFQQEMKAFNIKKMKAEQ